MGKDPIDLLGLDLKAKRAKVKVTMLTREAGWVRADLDRMIAGSTIMEISSHPKHPTILLIHDEFGREQLEEWLGFTDFEHQVITGLDNPDLPWSP